jgi:hypothetical protein
VQAATGHKTGHSEKFLGDLICGISELHFVLFTRGESAHVSLKSPLKQSRNQANQIVGFTPCYDCHLAVGPRFWRAPSVDLGGLILLIIFGLFCVSPAISLGALKSPHKIKQSKKNKSRIINTEFRQYRGSATRLTRARSGTDNWSPAKETS